MRILQPSLTVIVAIPSTTVWLHASRVAPPALPLMSVARCVCARRSRHWQPAQPALAPATPFHSTPGPPGSASPTHTMHTATRLPVTVILSSRHMHAMRACLEGPRTRPPPLREQPSRAPTACCGGTPGSDAYGRPRHLVPLRDRHAMRAREPGLGSHWTRGAAARSHHGRGREADGDAASGRSFTTTRAARRLRRRRTRPYHGVACSRITAAPKMHLGGAAGSCPVSSCRPASGREPTPRALRAAAIAHNWVRHTHSSCDVRVLQLHLSPCSFALVRVCSCCVHVLCHPSLVEARRFAVARGRRLASATALPVNSPCL